MSATGILPTYQRFVNGMPVPLRRSFRSRERSVICMVVVTLCLICFTTFFYLPEFKNSGGRVESVYRVYDQIKRSGPDLLIPPPPQLDDTQSKEAQRIFRHEDDAKNDPHIIGDREKLKVIKVSLILRNDIFLGEYKLQIVIKIVHWASLLR